MTVRARVIGLGQQAAGDVGAGLEVLARLRSLGVPDGVELIEARDAGALMDLLRTQAMVIVVDASPADLPGEVLELAADDLAVQALASASSDVLRVGQALAIAEELAPEEVTPDLRLVAVTIARTAQPGAPLSPAVAAAAARVAERVRAMLDEDLGSA
jgi:hydrogenase maturation protease